MLNPLHLGVLDGWVGGAKRAKRAISVKAAPPSRHFPGKGWSGWGSVLVFLFFFSF